MSTKDAAGASPSAGDGESLDSHQTATDPSHARPTRGFRDLALGERRRSRVWAVTAQDIVAFAREYDPQWFHIDAAAAQASSFQGLIASGVQTLGIWRRLDHDINGDIDNIAGLGLDEVRFLRPVRPGDRLCLESEIVDLARSGKGRARGQVTLRFRMSNQNGETVMTLTGTNLVHDHS